MRKIDIGILLAEKIVFELHGDFSCEGTILKHGIHTVTMGDGTMLLDGCSCRHMHLSPLSIDAVFTLHDVLIGVDFHWQRTQNQTFEGELIFLIENGKVRAVNRLPVENYLHSVISSEMSATASLEFLKAHTIISRSWLYAQLLRCGNAAEAVMEYGNENEIVRWYARENHTLFDLCADDHCQRYQGISSARNETVMRAVKETAGIVLAYEGSVCDARFSKCCGGVTERFSACWEDVDYDYLRSFRDNVDRTIPDDLTDEAAARRWIEEAPAAFCNTQDTAVLSQVLNGYDRETNDFYRWQVCYTQDELSQLVASRSGIDFGVIEDLQPVERATSGRLVRLRIVGRKRTLVVGKELEIRRWLSPSHLYSSAFVVDKESTTDGSVIFCLKGAGWGHGVGLCQIGAAMMGEKGYDYRRILEHYYPGAVLCDIDTL